MIPIAPVNNLHTHLNESNNNEDENSSIHSIEVKNHSQFPNQPPSNITTITAIDDDSKQTKTNNVKRYKTFNINKSNHINKHVQPNNLNHRHFESQLTGKAYCVVIEIQKKKNNEIFFLFILFLIIIASFVNSCSYILFISSLRLFI